VAEELGITGWGRRKKSLIHWRIPDGWIGKKPIFGYTPWRTMDGDAKGFFALHYTPTKDGWKLIKKVRFAKRKVAKERSWKWHEDFYKDPERLERQKILREKKLETMRKKQAAEPYVPPQLAKARKKLDHVQSVIRRHQNTIIKALEDVKRKKKLIKKWEKKEKYYQKRVASLESMGENRASTRKGGEFT
jgi:hypothetical protein